MRSVRVLLTCHHGNTGKVTQVLADVLGAGVKNPLERISGEFQTCDRAGFGSCQGKHHEELPDPNGHTSPVHGRRAFIISTCGITAIGLHNTAANKDHAALRIGLQAKGYALPATSAVRCST